MKAAQPDVGRVDLGDPMAARAVDSDLEAEDGNFAKRADRQTAAADSH